MMLCRMMFVILVFAAIESYGAVNVTASRKYVDQKVTSVSNSIMEEVSSKLRKIESIEENTYTKDETDEKVGAKQDKLPYPTNAIPYSSISGAPAAPVTSVNDKTGAVTIGKSDVGLGNVANTGDSATPVSGGTTKFTTGGAYTHLAKKQDKLPYPTNAIPPSAIYNPPWLTSFTESDPTIYSWAKAQTKPSYSWSEISGTANVSMFNNDAGYLKASYAAPVFDPTSTTRLQTDEVISIGDRIYRVDFSFNPSISPDPVEEKVVTELPDLKSLNEHILKQSFLAFGSGGTNLPWLKKIHVGYDDFTGRSAYLTLLPGGIEFDTSYTNESFRLLNGRLSYTDSGWSSFTEIDIRNILSSVNVVDFSNIYLNENYKKNPTSPYYVWRYLNEKYISSNDVELVYLKKSDAASTYLSKADAASIYATPSDVSESVQSAIGGVEIEYIYDWTGRYRTSQDGMMHRKIHNGFSVAFTNSNNGVYLMNAGVDSWICDNSPFGETLHFTRSNGIISCSEIPQLRYTEAYNGDCYINFPVLGGFKAIMPSGSPGVFYWEEYGEFAKKDEVPSSSTLTNAVRSVVSVTSSYIWDAQDECLYRREMKSGYLYWTPVTNVNALLPENIAILNYLEEHKND